MISSYGIAGPISKESFWVNFPFKTRKSTFKFLKYKELIDNTKNFKRKKGYTVTADIRLFVYYKQVVQQTNYTIITLFKGVTIICSCLKTIKSVITNFKSRSL